MLKQKNPFPIFFFLFGLTIVFLVLSSVGLFGGTIQSAFVSLQKNVIHIISTNDNKDIANLKQQNLSLLEKLTEQKKLQQENTAFHDQFTSAHVAVSSLLPATIVSEPSFTPGVSSPEYLILDQGIKSGVKVGQSVVYKNNVIGLIAKANDSFSQVTLLTNTTVSFPVKTIKTGALGIAKGQGNGILVLDNVVLSDQLEKDDMVETYGNQALQGTGYSPGLLVGIVTDIEKSPSAIFQKGRIKSLVDVTRLTTVFVVINK